MLLLTLLNYAGCQIERCTHQSRDEPFETNSHIYDIGRRYCAFLTHLCRKKRLFLPEIGVYLSRALQKYRANRDFRKPLDSLKKSRGYLAILYYL
jgi:hypothetical protein